MSTALLPVTLRPARRQLPALGRVLAREFGTPLARRSRVWRWVSSWFWVGMLGAYRARGGLAACGPAVITAQRLRPRRRSWPLKLVLIAELLALAAILGGLIAITGGNALAITTSAALLCLGAAMLIEMAPVVWATLRFGGRVRRGAAQLHTQGHHEFVTVSALAGEGGFELGQHVVDAVTGSGATVVIYARDDKLARIYRWAGYLPVPGCDDGRTLYRAAADPSGHHGR
jgi:hypothetical protein